ncbi:MAG: CoA transferase [Chloroflexi bacterium]|nr:CoA transferase [Chloroflexota bacterium]MCI0771934.1 CoA transferase [Chloroflexota bacterium]MCI0805535.1 CoA transferase [Chloroflexota bacterium]MCI0827559.1 CoA transferase [Chloroflexota bacterium]MCI0853121.1 CoA transferase [Chloroflexota bacterium]
MDPPANSDPLLDGVRVLDLTRILAGPYCTMLLGDLGADIIKVEVPGRGDDTRQWGPPFTTGGESAYFLAANRNKRSLTLNLKSERGRSILGELIQQADILIENFRVGTLEKWDLSYEQLKNLRPDLIYCTITGYGYTGPYRDRPGYDFIIQAMGGFMSVTGPEDGEPFRAGIAVADLSSGIYACNAVLAALYARERTGKGQRIDISLLDCQVAMMSYVASNFLVSGEPPQRFGNAHPNLVPYQVFEAQDGYFAFAAGNDLQWANFCRAVGREAWGTDPLFATNPARLTNRTKLVGLLNELFSTRSVADWIELCEGAGLPVGPINTMEAALSDPQVLARGMVMEVPHPTEGSVPLLRSPLNIPTAPSEVRYPPPTLGQHTDEILSELLNYDSEGIQALRESEVV